MKVLLAWFRENRTSPRAAFTLRLACTVAASFLSLFWTRWLLHRLGQESYGLYTSFLGFIALASAGELGLGGAVAFRTNHLLAAGDLAGLRALHGTARRLFLGLSILATLLTLALAPWLPGWLHFPLESARGPLVPLFALGAAQVGFVIYNSFLNNSSHGLGMVVWPILPYFVTSQLIAAVQIWMATHGHTLWAMHAAVLLVHALNVWIAWIIYRHSHPVFAEKLPYPRSSPALRQLAIGSIWTYLITLATLVYTSTDRLVVNAFLGAASVPVLLLNARLTEFGQTIITSVSGMSLPRLISLLLSQDPAEAAQGREFATRLARLQGFMGLALALGYLWINDLFVQHFFGPGLRAPGTLVPALACALVLTTNLDVYLQLTSRWSEGGLRWCALGVGGSALLNFGLTWLSARQFGWLSGVAWSTAVAQGALLLWLGFYILRHTPLFTPWPFFRGSLLYPLGTLAVALLARASFPPVTLIPTLLLAVIFAGLLGSYSALAGPRLPEIGEEVRLILRRFRRPAGA